MKLIAVVGIVVGIAIAAIIVVIVAAWALVDLHLMSYTATGSETLSPTGAAAGNALGAYDPGITGEARSAATDIADDLRSRGYKVELAGIKSATAANVSGYDVIIVGGPMYDGAVISTVETYLKALTPQRDAKLGVFGTTGWGEIEDANIAGLEAQVNSSSNLNALDQRTATKTIRSGNNFSVDCGNLVSAVLQ